MLAAHYADALPLDLLREEQSRIETERAQANRIIAAAQIHFDVIEDKLDLAMRMLTNTQRAYFSAAKWVRRDLNQTLFEAIYIFNGIVIGVDLAEPFGQLLSHQSVAEDIAIARIERPSGDFSFDAVPRGRRVQSSNVDLLAEGMGFEPMRPLAGPSNFQDCRLRPLGHPSGIAG